MNKIKSKILFLEKIFKNYNYNLNFENIKDLKRRLISKPVQIYLLAIEFLKKNKTKINYKNVKNLIILDIRIRDNIKKVITAIEEAIWVQLIDQKIQFEDFNRLKIFNNKNDKLYEIINKLKQEELHLIRKIRNSVNHLVYPILFNKFEKIIKEIQKFKNIDFIENKIIDKLLTKIWQTNDDIKLKCINDLFMKNNDF